MAGARGCVSRRLVVRLFWSCAVLYVVSFLGFFGFFNFL